MNNKNNNKNEFKLITFCSLNNENKDFDVDECEQGDLSFKVPIDWLIEKINSKKVFPFGRNNLNKIETTNDLEKWSDLYTHMEGEFLYREAISENVIIGSPIVIGCNYCK